MLESRAEKCSNRGSSDQDRQIFGGGNLRSPTSMYKIHQNVSIKLRFLSIRVTTSIGKVLRLISVADICGIKLVESPFSNDFLVQLSAEWPSMC